MNSIQLLAAFSIAAAAAVLIPTTRAAATPNCDGTAAFTHVGYQLNGGPETGKLSDLTGRIHPGDRLSVTSQQRSECADMAHSIVFYGVAQGRFDPTEVQLIITATPVDGSDIIVPSSTHDGQCQVQIDDITGPALTIIDGNNRYNEQPIGGTRNRLVLTAGYTTDAVCEPLLPPTSAPVTVTTTAPPTVDVPLTEAPTTTAPAPVPPVGPVPSTPTAVVGGDPVPLRYELPVTGVDSAAIARYGLGFLGLGALLALLAWALTPCRRTIHTLPNNQETSKVTKRKYIVSVPFAGSFDVDVPAESESEAIDKALNVYTDISFTLNAEDDTGATWLELGEVEFHREMVRGNIVAFSQNAACVVGIEDDEESAK